MEIVVVCTEIVVVRVCVSVSIERKWLIFLACRLMTYFFPVSKHLHEHIVLSYIILQKRVSIH